ncbi:MAG: hypothetical protein ACP5N7_01000 [Candidatus Pacearchaeota archaeon]
MNKKNIENKAEKKDEQKEWLINYCSKRIALLRKKAKEIKNKNSFEYGNVLGEFEAYRDVLFIVNVELDNEDFDLMDLED